MVAIVHIRVQIVNDILWENGVKYKDNMLFFEGNNKKCRQFVTISKSKTMHLVKW